jgi:hypothetical protein
VTPPWLRREEGRLLLALHCQPGAKADAVMGLHGERLKVRIQAPPVDGKANERLCAFLAEAFGVPGRRVTVVAGASGRDKLVEIRAPTRSPAWLPAEAG